MTRYARQTILEEIGQKGQDKLARASVLVVGAGGLGSPALLYLAAAGVGHIGIADFDKVSISNLQRQILFDTHQTDTQKVAAASKRLGALNPEIIIETYENGLTLENAETLFSFYDIIIDGTDNFETKYLINDAGVKFGKPVIYGALNKFEGQVAVFDSANGGPCYRCLHPEKPTEHVPNCAEAGVLGAVAGITGVTQALQAIQLIIGHDAFAPLIGKFWSIDTKTMQTRLLELPKDPACPVCSKDKDDITLTHTQEICMSIPEISVEEIKAMDNPIIYDTREQEEWDEGHIEGATLLPLSQLLAGNMPELPKDREIIFQCRSGQRSRDAAMLYKAKGYDNIKNMTGGYLAWTAAA